MVKIEEKSARNEAIAFFKSMALVFIPTIVLILLLPLLGWLDVLLIIAWVLISCSVTVYCWLAPNNILFSFVYEGTARIVVRFGGYRKTLITWRNRDVRESGEIFYLKDNKNSWGGLNFIGWPFIDRVMTYKYSWISSDDGNPNIHEERETNQFYLEIANYFIGLGLTLQHDSRTKKTTVIEDMKSAPEDSDGIPLMVSAVCTISISNPRIAFLENNKWYENAIAIIKGVLREEISNAPFAKLNTNKKGLSKLIHERIANEPHPVDYFKKLLIGLDTGFDIQDKDKTITALEYLNKYVGVTLHAFEVNDISPGSNWRELTLKKVTAEREKEVTIINADAKKTATETIAAGNRNAKAMEIGGAAMSTFYEISGLTEEKVNAMRRLQPEAFEKMYGNVLRDCLEKVLLAYKISNKAFMELKTNGGGVANPVMEAIFAAEIAKDAFPAREAQPASKQENTANSSEKKTSESKKNEGEKKGKKKEKNYPNAIENGKLTQEARDALEGEGLDADEELQKYEADNGEWSQEAKDVFYAESIEY
ncbi:MAG: SPFH domain-containing protein [Candidatus Paceibacterota bacterium]